MGLEEVAPHDDRMLNELADVLFGSHKIIVVTGAGISTSCGIPDFRSKDGLYSLIPEQSFPPTPPPSLPSTPSRKRKAYTSDDEDPPPSSQCSSTSGTSRRISGKDLFDSSIWTTAPSVFYRFIASLRQKIHEDVRHTSATHKFIRTLRDGGRLLRCYTQNVDNLEAREGLCMDLERGKGNKRRFMKKCWELPLPEQTRNTDFDGGCEVVPLHGDIDKLRCTLCQAVTDWTSESTEDFMAGQAPECGTCTMKSDQRQANGKRGLAVGTLRPNIVLYGEEHPSNTLLSPLVPFDVAAGPEVLLIMGTSMKVFGLQKLIRDFAKAVHQQKDGKGKVIFINRTRPAESIWDGVIDFWLPTDCDDWVEDLHRRRPDLWLRQGDLNLKVVKQVSKKKRKSAEADSENPSAKRAKFAVEIPRKIAKPKATKSSKAKPERPVLGSVTNFSAMAPRTPRPLSRSWKISKTNHLNALLLSPLVQSRRPQPSPLSATFKLRGCALMAYGSETPQRPIFSPITSATNTPAKKMRNIFEEIRAETHAVGSPFNDENLVVDVGLTKEQHWAMDSPSRVGREARVGSAGLLSDPSAVLPSLSGRLYESASSIMKRIRDQMG